MTSAFRSRYHRRKAAGVCVRCGEWPPASGRVMCEPCADVQRQWITSRARKRKADGVCVRCREPLAPSSVTYCTGCRDKARAYQRAYKRRPPAP